MDTFLLPNRRGMPSPIPLRWVIFYLPMLHKPLHRANLPKQWGVDLSGHRGLFLPIPVLYVPVASTNCLYSPTVTSCVSMKKVATKTV